jgi:hypothetical protein
MNDIADARSYTHILMQTNTLNISMTYHYIIISTILEQYLL